MFISLKTCSSFPLLKGISDGSGGEDDDDICVGGVRANVTSFSDLC